MKIFSIAVMISIYAGISFSAIITREVTYSADSLTMKGYLAYDDAITRKAPGILVVHEWWGQNEYSRHRAEMLAQLGYVAFAVDMYGNGKQADHPDDAGKFAAEASANMEKMKARFIAAMEALKKDPHVEPGEIGAIGYCFGGGVVLKMARDGADLKAVASFHGALPPAKVEAKGSIKTKLLVCNGADDKFISADAIKDFKAEMNAAGADMKFINYPGAIHGFSNPASTEIGKKFNLAIAYNENADKKSWEEMKKLFKKAFKK